jgi:GNAT superfamily N-acetyltransferase
MKRTAPTTTAPHAPDEKKRPSNDEDGGDDDGSESEESQRGEMASFRLFVAVARNTAESDTAQQQQPHQHQHQHQRDEEDEEELGTEDSNTSDDDDGEEEGGSGGSMDVTLLEWTERRFPPTAVAAIKAMSRKIYDHTTEGWCEIDAATTAATTVTEAAEWAYHEGDRAGVVGMLVLREPQPQSQSHAEITQLYVLPSHRDRGIGRDLVEYCLDWLHAASSLASASASASSPSPSPSQSLPVVDCFAVGGSYGFYRRVGFVPVDKPDNPRARCEMQFRFPS